MLQAVPKMRPLCIQATVLLPMTRFGASKLMCGSWEVRLASESTATRRPGMIMPPRNCLSRSTTEIVVAVPISTMISGQG